MSSRFAEIIRGSGLVSGKDRGVVMVSGGADSVALLTGLVELLVPGNLVALHVNYGLRPEADHDERLVRSLCEQLGVDCVVRGAGRPEGNIQAWAREVRHAEAEKLRATREMDWVAVGHTRSDQAETFVYRLASSPGVRPLLAMPARAGNLIRPLLGVSGRYIREHVHELATEVAEDASNQNPGYARNRIRLNVMPELELINPGVERNIARTRQELAEDEEALSAMAAEALARARETGDGGIAVAALVEAHPAVSRRMIRLLAESTLGRPVAVSGELAAEALRLSSGPEGGMLDLGGGDLLVMEAGRVNVRSRDNAGMGSPAPVRLDPRTGHPTLFGGWELESAMTAEDEARKGFGDPWTAFIDPGGEDPSLILRAWQAGDRIEPLGMSGSKKLQDVFTDALVPASRRHDWPVLVAGETIIWVPGLVRSRHLLISGPDVPVLRLRARSPFDP